MRSARLVLIALAFSWIAACGESPAGSPAEDVVDSDDIATIDAFEDTDTEEDPEEDVDVRPDPDVVEEDVEDIPRFDIPPDVPDTEECTGLGCPCDDDDDCDADFCVRHPDGGQVCSERCGEECSLEGYECRVLQDGGDIVRYCVPLGDPYCDPCEIDADCLTTDNLCVELTDGDFCATSCADGEPCPEGASCTGVLVGDDRVLVCVPDDNQCSACIDEDGDLHGSGPACAGLDCNDDLDSVYEGAPERCDGLDNDCDEGVDEDFPNLGQACGTCGSGTYECRDLGVACVGDEGDAALNVCGGCARLTQPLGAGCGPCAAVWTCDGTEAMACVGDTTDTDGDTVCDVDDRCPGHDDRNDRDGDGIPDACDGPPPECETSDECPAVSFSPWGACEEFASVCANEGTRSRTRTEYSCVEGACVASLSDVTEACTRNSDGDECSDRRVGAWTECGGFSGTCDDTGTRSRVITTYACAEGGCVATPELQYEACGRVTESTPCGAGTVFTDWTECSGFSGTCGETGTQTRLRTDYQCVSASCERIDTPQSQACGRETDGDSCGGGVVYGEWSECGGFASPCDETGTRNRTRTEYSCTDTACVGDETIETETCLRPTEGDVCGAGTTYSAWSSCGEFDGTCGEEGVERRIRTDYTCQDSACVGSNTGETRPCARDTEDIVCGSNIVGAWSICSYETACGEAGTRTRSITSFACSEGVCTANESTQEDGCVRDTDGSTCQDTALGAWTECAGFDSVCDRDGTRSRDVTTYACVDGGCVGTTETQDGNCTRFTNGLTCADIELGDWSTCQTGSVCGESGTWSRTRVDYACNEGVCVSSETEEEEACTRDTDGTSCFDRAGCRITTCSDGVCPAGTGCSGLRFCCEPGICIDPATSECP